MVQKARMTERGEIMRYFLSRINPSRTTDGLAPMTMGHLGKLLEKIPTKDLYYLKRVCNDASNFSKKFWWELDPTKHTEAELAKNSLQRRAASFQKKKNSSY